MKDIHDAYEFLVRAAPRPGIQQISGQLEDNFKNDVEFWHTVRWILKMSNHPGSTSNQQGETLTHCAYWIAKKSNYNKAESLLREARLKFASMADLHNVAVVAWMRGSLLWQIPDVHDKAIGEWISSIDLFERILTEGSFRIFAEQAKEYHKHLLEMNVALAQAVKDNGLCLKWD